MLSLFRHAKSSRKSPGELVQAAVPEMQDAEIAAAYNAQRMGGDFYDFLRVSPNRVLFGLLDVAGGREEAQGIVAAAKETFRKLGQELFSQEEVNEADAMNELFLQLNRTVLETAVGVHSCPAFAGCYNEDLGIVSYFNAGHTPGFLRDNASVTQLPATGLPLGLFSHTTSDSQMVVLEPGAALLLASRGIVEAKCKDQEFGLDGVQNMLQHTEGETANQLCVNLLDKVQDFMCRPPTDNDVTVMALVRDAIGKTVAA
jgi:serine phosphatase RsbU (regulator of sigma subunit)